jgi:hypothetical protein
VGIEEPQGTLHSERQKGGPKTALVTLSLASYSAPVKTECRRRVDPRRRRRQATATARVAASAFLWRKLAFEVNFRAFLAILFGTFAKVLVEDHDTMPFDALSRSPKLLSRQLSGVATEKPSTWSPELSRRTSGS